MDDPLVYQRNETSLLNLYYCNVFISSKLEVGSSKSGAALARVLGVQRNPSIFREGFSTLSIFGQI